MMPNGVETRRVARAAGAVLVLLAFTAPAVAAAEVESAVDMKLWGRTVFNVHYDTAILSQDFMSYITADDDEEFNFNPRDTRFGFAASTSNGDWSYQAKMELDFYGDNASNNLLPRLRLGFAEARHASGLRIRAGQDWIPVAQQNPGTIDFGIQSWSGNLWWRVPQVTVRYGQPRYEFLVSAMKHRIATPQEQEETMPWVLGRAAVHDLLGDGSLLAIGGGFRSVTVDGADYSPYMVAAEFKVPVGDTGVVVNGEVYLDEGAGREFVHYGFDYNPDHPDGAREIASQGGFVSVKAPTSARTEVNAGFGLDDPDSDDLAGMRRDAPYLLNKSAFANFKYKVTPQFGWGLEVIHFETDVAVEGGTDDLSGQRFTGSWWYIF